MGELRHDIVVKAWEVHQSLIKGMGESCWKIRSILIATASGLIAFGYTSSQTNIYLMVIPISVMFFILEAGYLRIQDAYISKSIAIEKCINDILVGEKYPRFPQDGIGTTINTPTFRGLLKQFRIKKQLFWFSYLLIIIIATILYIIDFKPISGVSPASVRCSNVTNHTENYIYNSYSSNSKGIKTKQQIKTSIKRQGLKQICRPYFATCNCMFLNCTSQRGQSLSRDNREILK